MSATFQPFGLKPAYHPSGLDRSVPFVGTNNYNLTSTTAGAYSAPYSLTGAQVAFYQYTPVAITSTGQLTIANQTAASGKVYGSFDGVEYTTAEGRRTVGKSITATSLAAATQIVFWIFQDPALVYEIQVNGSANVNAIGTEYNFDTTANSLVTDGYTIGTGGAGFSTTALLATSVGTGNQGQVRVVGLGREVAYPAGNTNQWGDAYTIVQVVIANNTFAANSVSV
jgi:hypothetical protein